MRSGRVRGGSVRGNVGATATAGAKGKGTTIRGNTKIELRRPFMAIYRYGCPRSL